MSTPFEEYENRVAGLNTIRKLLDTLREEALEKLVAQQKTCAHPTRTDYDSPFGTYTVCQTCGESRTYDCTD